MKVNQVRAGAVLSYVSIILSTVISFVYTPIMIGRLGDSEYGVYQFVLPIISYLSLLSFGLGSAYVRYYSRFKAADDRDGMRKLNGMFLLAYTKDGRPIMGLPGCVMYAKRTIFDLVLPRVMADERVTAQDLAKLGMGGLCLGCPTCIFPNCGFGK